MSVNAILIIVWYASFRKIIRSAFRLIYLVIPPD